MTKNNSKSVSKINALRSKCQPVHVAAGTFNQAVKSLAGLESKHAEVLEALGIESFGFKSVCAGWADALRISVDGKPVMGLYMSEAAKVTVTNEKGEPKEVNMYERIETKKGVKYVAEAGYHTKRWPVLAKKLQVMKKSSYRMLKVYRRV